jgi:DNA-binding CsgD family transcriptional regulator
MHGHPAQEAAAAQCRGSRTVLVNGREPFADLDSPVDLFCRWLMELARPRPCVAQPAWMRLVSDALVSSSSPAKRILPLLLTHLTLAGIADRLFLSRHTVKAQVWSIYRKLDVHTRADAVARARELNVLES